MSQPNCSTCRHHYVTWRPATPRGCRAFGFQCRGLPAQVIQRESGRPCQLFEARPRPKGSRGPKR